MAQPISYLSTEPAGLRANRNHFDATLQIYDRADALEACGHVVDKIEVHWPSGSKQTLANIKANQLIKITEKI